MTDGLNINELVKQTLQQPQNVEKQTYQPASSASSAQAGSQSAFIPEIQLSPAGQEAGQAISQAMQSLRTLPEVPDLTRIEDLQQQINQGNYSVIPEDIAAKIMLQIYNS